ncbi:MAG TPA: hypothetical protein VIM19_11420 [Actinomycetes bacterium]
MTSTEGTTRWPHGRRCHNHRAATAMSGSHTARSWRYTGLLIRPVPSSIAAGSPSVSARVIGPSQASAFSVTMTQA